MVNPITLEEHDAKSEARAESIKQTIREAAASVYSGENEMNAPGNMFSESAQNLGGYGGGALGGLGAGLVGGLLGGLLFDRGGVFGGRGGEVVGGGNTETRIESDIYNTAVLQKLGSIESAIPLQGAQTENVILQQTNQITNLASQAQLANAAGFAATKDAVQNAGVILLNAINTVNQNVSEQGCQTREVVQAGVTSILSRIDANTIANLQAELAESRSTGRARETEVNVTQTVNQNQQQAQAQVQLQNIGAAISSLLATNQNIHQGIINLGSMSGAAGQQTAANTRV